MSDITDRLSLFIEKSGKKKKDIADALGISPAAVTKMCSGKNNPSSQSISLICMHFGVSERWLRTGEGEMMEAPSHDEELAKWIGDIQFKSIHKDRVALIKKKLLLALSHIESDEAWLAWEQVVEEIAASKKNSEE